jgi:hypothetical protein
MKDNRVYSYYKPVMRDEAQRIRCICGLLEPPFDLPPILKHFKAELHQERLTGLDGYVERCAAGPQDWTVHVNSDSAWTRQRFTVAHEIGHIVLMNLAERGGAKQLIRYRTGRTSDTRFVQDPTEEALCNYFATELLLPSRLMDGMVARDCMGPNVILMLADLFKVSLQMCANALARLIGLQKSSCALWDPSLRWPVAKWRVGLEPAPGDLSELEALVSETASLRIPLSKKVPTFGRRQQTMYIRTQPTSRGQFILTMVCASGGAPAPNRSHPVLPTQMSLW